MFNSKALKEFKEPSKLYSWWIETTISEYYYNFVNNFIKNPIFQAKRLYGWQVNAFEYDYDFDFHGIFAIIEYKLKRLEKALINGHAIQEDKDLQALRIAIKLAGRLKVENYSEPFWKRHDRKWGESKNWFEPCNDGSGSSYWHHSRLNANTPEEIEQERKEFLAYMNASDAKMRREEKWLYDLLFKYGRKWWD